jgi:serine/threonine protein kinase
MCLKILEMIRAGDKHSAQVVTVQVLYVDPLMTNPPPIDVPLIAKFYDPLYFDHERDDVDPFLCIDHAYSHEAAAYKALHKLQGTIIPRFYGSHTCELQILNENALRSVRLILMENVHGTCMQKLNPMEFTQSERQNILKAIVDAESLIYTYNVRHRDVHPRNILVLHGDLDTMRVIFVDFGKSLIGRAPPHVPPEEEQKYDPGVPISPLLRWNQAWWHFEEWIDWEWHGWLEYNYSSTRTSIMADMAPI